MTLQQLHYLVEVSKCQSITVAAQRLYIAQPSLSKAIKELEKEFHITILERTRHGVSFTVEGMEFLDYAHRILEQVNGLQNYFNPETKSNKLSLTVSAQHYMFSIDALTTFVKQLNKKHNYTIVFNECRTSQVIQDVLLGQSQLGILFLSRGTNKFMKRLFAQKGIEFTPLRQFPPYVYLGHNHPLRDKKELTIEDLQDYPYIKYFQGSDSYQYAEEISVHGIQDNRLLVVSDRSTILRLLACTDAYTIGCGCLLPDITEDRILSIPLAGPFDLINIGWIRLKNTNMTPEMLQYVDMLEDSLDTLSHPQYGIK
ncbi:LysR family transcriptional regulator [Veillonella sp.]|uniref:LysR family transcriptional regulator n=1 Tax=Veillonella sp. TaxID=1926307 RepID=UPI0025E41757|nr:LysR family transcriptional regulator [Veillonella sp.]